MTLALIRSVQSMHEKACWKYIGGRGNTASIIYKKTMYIARLYQNIPKYIPFY
jgi:hypothetical protein